MDEITRLIENLKKYDGNLEWVIAALENDSSDREDTLEAVNEMLEDELSYAPDNY